jgi:hypothetical protein
MRRTKFSPVVLNQIGLLLDQGLSPVQIADKIGCKLGTLRVRCSEHGISLRRPPRGRATKRRELKVRLVILLTKSASESLQRTAKTMRISRTKLGALLLETVARDELYNAVLDAE